jgi:3,4-dihydroxy 2-butanone 4-phosphate synthase/GTP cyclohydrolase II
LEPETTELSTIEEAIDAIRCGGMAIVVDDPARENEGDLVMAADWVTPQAVTFMATHGRGLICVPLLAERLHELGIPGMPSNGADAHATAFHASVDHCTTTTGIPAVERANTIRALASGQAVAPDFRQPGHVFPLRYAQGGVLRRAGHTEAAVDLAVLADRAPAAIICEIADDNGEMARLPALLDLAKAHSLPIVSIADLIAYRRVRERLVVRAEAAVLPLNAAEFRIIGYTDLIDDREHAAITLGDLDGARDALVRIHSECLTGDVFGSQRCDCGDQLATSLEMIAANGVGAAVYIRGHEGRGIGLLQKIHAYKLQDQGLDTVEANVRLGLPVDERDYSIGAQILRDLGVGSVRLMTNNPAKAAALAEHGLTVSQLVPLHGAPGLSNIRYLRTKQAKLGHTLMGLHATEPVPSDHAPEAWSGSGGCLTP